MQSVNDDLGLNISARWIDASTTVVEFISVLGAAIVHNDRASSAERNDSDQRCSTPTSNHDGLNHCKNESPRTGKVKSEMLVCLHL